MDYFILRTPANIYCPMGSVNLDNFVQVLIGLIHLWLRFIFAKPCLPLDTRDVL